MFVELPVEAMKTVELEKGVTKIPAVVKKRLFVETESYKNKMMTTGKKSVSSQTLS